MMSRIYQMKKRILASLLMLLMMISVLTGCAPSGNVSGAGSSTASVSAQELPATTKAKPADTASAVIEQPTKADKAAKSTKAATKAAAETSQAAAESETAKESAISEDGSYTSKAEVALYLHTYGHLPDNYITKKDAEALGWDSKKGNLWDVAPGKSIGGSHFGNYEKQLPEAKGRKYSECDIDYDGTYRNAKRIIYSNDGLIFYTEDHYKTFEQLY
jgi:guanyl-specific ribonuclease Sa